MNQKKSRQMRKAAKSLMKEKFVQTAREVYRENEELWQRVNSLRTTVGIWSGLFGLVLIILCWFLYGVMR